MGLLSLEIIKFYLKGIYIMKNKSKNLTSNLYHIDGKISVGQAIPFGLQHILAMFVANIAPILL